MAKTKILVVDDEPGFRDLLTYELSQNNFEVQSAASASEAFQILNQNAFDVIITDIRMPGGMDGVQFIETYNKQKPEQKTIFMTGYAVEDRLQKATELGLGRCLKKPFLMQELVSLLHSMTPS